MNTKNLASVGLYRHFKGAYYYVTHLSKHATDEKTIMVNYFNVCHPEYGYCSRPLDDFSTDYEIDSVTKEVKYIVNRPDNITGQHLRFERVQDLNFQLGSVSTEQLVDELRRRTDSPIHELDIEALHSKVFSKDYVVGEAFEATEDTPKGVYTLSSFDTKEQAEKCFYTKYSGKRVKLFKRVFIEVD